MSGKGKVVDIDHGWAQMLSDVKKLADGAYAKVGILAASERGGLHETDPETGKAAALTVAEIAAVNEFGTEDGHIPARPAHRMTFDRMRGQLEVDSRTLLMRVLDRKITVEGALGVLGLKLATEIKKTIATGAQVPPPNAPSTVLAKVPQSYTGARRAKAIAGNRTLVDTGRTLGAIAWAVVLGTVTKELRYLTERGGE